MTFLHSTFNKLKYRKGAFIIDEESIFNISRLKEYWENDPCGMFIVDPEEEITDSSQLESRVNLWHEYNHYLQDLTLFACQTENLFMDMLSSLVRTLTSCDGIAYPLMDKANRASNLLLNISGEYQDALNQFYRQADIYDYIFRQSHRLPDTDEYALPVNEEERLNYFSLSYNDLLESYAYLKSHVDLFLWCNNNPERTKTVKTYIHQRDGIVPIVKCGDTYEYDKSALRYKRPYEIVRYLFVLCFSRLPWTDMQGIYQYMYEEMPEKYIGTKAWEMYIYILFSLETALSIPSADKILDILSKDKDRSIEEFSPVHRFYKVLKTIVSYGGFPPAKDKEKWYFTYFEWVSNFCGWMSYQDMKESHLELLGYRYGSNREAAVFMTYMGIVCKDENYAYILHAPEILMGNINAPIFIRDLSQNTIVITGPNAMWHTTAAPGYIMYFYNWPKKHQMITKVDTVSQRYDKMHDNNLAFYFEALHRAMMHELLEGMMYQGYFSCPLSAHDCPYCHTSCYRMNSIFSSASYCENKVLIINNLTRILEKPYGNFPNCVLLNLALKNRFNLKNMKFMEKDYIKLLIVNKNTVTKELSNRIAAITERNSQKGSLNMADAAALSVAFFTVILAALTIHIQMKKPLPDDDFTTEAAMKVKEKGKQYGFLLTTKQAIELLEIALKNIGVDVED